MAISQENPKNNKPIIYISVILVVIIGLFITIYATSDESASTTKSETFISQILSPIRVGFNVVAEKISTIPDYFASLTDLQTENDTLTNQIAQLEMTINSMIELSNENERLSDLLDMESTLDGEWDTSVSEVIGRSTNYWYNTITITGGTDKGYEEDMTVINGQGLVGRIDSVSATTSEVILITDYQGAVGAMLQDTRTVGIVEASTEEDGSLQMIHLSYEAEVDVNQIVITSGLGGIYPKGLLIGYITEVSLDPGGLLQTAVVQPFVDFDRLEEVFVLIPKGSDDSE